MVVGLEYREDFVTRDEERQLIAALEGLDWQEIVMRGQAAKRTVRHFGLRYDYDSRKSRPGDPLPEELEWLRERARALVPADLEQILLTRYPEGAGIGWHRDAPQFGQIVGVSLGAPCRMRFRRDGEKQAVALAPRSAYVMDGEARWEWEHSIPAAKGLRYSVTFRTLSRVAAS